MSLGRHGHVARALVGLCALLAATQAPAFEVELAAVSRDSGWRESDASGAVLVRETGRLNGGQATLAGEVGPDWGAALTARQVTGERAYAGQTQAGQPAQSSAGIRERLWEATVLRRLGAGWRGTAGWQRMRVERDLRDTENASGYPESWRWDALSLGLDWQRRFEPERLHLRLHGRVGAVVSSAMTVMFPGRDATRLEPARGRLAEVGAALRWDLADGRHAPALVLSVDRAFTRFQASPSAPVTSAGVLRGAARQPQTDLASTGVTIGLLAGW